VEAFLLLVAGAALGGVVTIFLSRLTPQLVFHPDIHWSPSALRYQIRVRNAGHALSRRRAGNPDKHERRASRRWGHVIDLKMTVTLIVRDGTNWRRLNIPALNGEFAHLQPGDTRFLMLDTGALTPAAQELLLGAAKVRGCLLELSEPALLKQMLAWQDCYVLVEAVGNDAWSAARRCWERRYQFGAGSTALHSGVFPAGPGADRVICR
jgi:hypothetical protein